MKKINNIFLYLVILFAVASVISEIAYHTSHSYHYSLKKIEKKIFSFEKNSSSFIKNILDNYEDYIDENKAFPLQSSYTYLIYSNDNLVFWSNNLSNYPYDQTYLQNSNIYESNNAIFYVKHFNKDNINIYSLLTLKHLYNIENKYVNNNINAYFKISNIFDFNFSPDTNSQIIKDSSGNNLFSLVYKRSGYQHDISILSSILFIFFSLSLLCLIINYTNKNAIRVLILVFLRIIVKIITNNYIDNSLFNHNAFNLFYLFDSVGDFLISSSFIFIFACFSVYYSKQKISFKSKLLNILFIIAMTVVITLSILYGNKINFLLRFDKITIDKIFILSSILIIASTTILLFLFLIKQSVNKKINSTTLSIIYIGFLTAFFTYLITLSNNDKEKINAHLIAKNNVFVQNSLFEETINWIFEEYQKDSAIYNLQLYDSLQNKSSIYFDKFIEKTLNEKYLSKYYFKYIIADSSTTINIDNTDNVYNCNQYFENCITDNSSSKKYENLFYIRNFVDVPYYIYKLQVDKYTIWVDIVPKYNIEGIGFSELLSNPESQFYSINLSEYSIAIYIDNVFIRSLGNFSYDNYFNFQEKNLLDKGFFIAKNYKHYVCYDQQEKTIILVSKKFDNFSFLITPFSFIFILLLLINFLITIILSFNNQRFNIQSLSLKQKMQISTILIFIIISLLICVFTIVLITRQNNSKNKNVLLEKIYSLSRNFESIINTCDEPTNIDFSKILRDLSSIYFLDINIYDETGILVETSNEQFFLNNLYSPLMNPEAYYYLNNKNIYIHTENIGTYKYLSAYMTVLYHNDEFYFLNVPYFTKQAELNSEITKYIMSFVNLYLLLIIIAVVATYFLSKIITHPLDILKNILSTFSLEQTNQKIPSYKHNDEISKLIEIYNIKIDELENSVKLLTKAERESAWREMAQQVAHEIKNPLTPMKLSSQHLYKLWKNKDTNFDDQITKYTKTIIDQIDYLSEIATSFSNFAKMPEVKAEKINIYYLLQKVCDFYLQTNVNIVLSCDADNIYVFADSGLLIRVFHNLIKNSIQAFDNANFLNKKLIIEIIISVDDCFVNITIKDNGPGINSSVKDKIFVPNFTTKTNGTGLGLAIVKNIINDFGGEIENIESKDGALFKIKLPLNY